MSAPSRFRGPGRPPASESRDRVADLIAAARRRFAEDGYGGATLTAIAADSGLSLAALYHYFPDKRALFESVYRDTLEARWTPWIAELEGLDPALDLATKLRSVEDPGADPDEAEGAFFMAAQVHARRIPELNHLLDERATYRRRGFSLLVGTLAEEGRFRGASTTDEAIEILEVAITGWTFESIFDPERAEQYLRSTLAIADALVADRPSRS